MPRHIVTKLSPVQEAMLPNYRDKWRSIAMLTEPINPQKVSAIIKAAYTASHYPEPEIWFYGNPFVAIKQILATQDFEKYAGNSIRLRFSKRVIDHLHHGIKQQLGEGLAISLRNQIQFPEFPHYPTESNPQASFFPYGIEQCTELQLMTDLDQSELEFANVSDFAMSLVRPAGWSIWGCMFDFCISVLGLHHDREKWKVFQELMQYCGFIFQFEKVCIACDRPCKLSFDHDNRLHAEGEPALQFADGYGVYARHGIHPSQEMGSTESETP
ncbi:MAG: hypothetical protein SFY66_27815 [Oculatellaceae cyanobacterium bins.114]|nr:hypothetical protein [Oculatellaceae cyanobacterium bins.114]